MNCHTQLLMIVTASIVIEQPSVVFSIGYDFKDTTNFQLNKLRNTHLSFKAVNLSQETVRKDDTMQGLTLQRIVLNVVALRKADIQASSLT